MLSGLSNVALVRLYYKAPYYRRPYNTSGRGQEHRGRKPLALGYRERHRIGHPPTNQLGHVADDGVEGGRIHSLAGWPPGPTAPVEHSRASSSPRTRFPLLREESTGTRFQVVVNCSCTQRRGRRQAPDYVHFGPGSAFLRGRIPCLVAANRAASRPGQGEDNQELTRPAVQERDTANRETRPEPCGLRPVPGDK